MGKSKLKFVALAALCLASLNAFARDVEYTNGEVDVRVAPGEPTQVQFPGTIAGGFKKKLSALSLDKKSSDLIIFANEGISDSGEAIIVRLEDGRSYSLRIRRAGPDSDRDTIVSISDDRSALIAASQEEEDAPYREKSFPKSPSTQVAGLMREMMLMAEFGKKSVPGYRSLERYRGEVVLDDGTIKATVDKILIGPNLWGYVIDAQNMLDTGQKIDPASFRIDGTRAVSANRWELAPRPLNIEEQVSGKDKAKVYVVTRAKKDK